MSIIDRHTRRFNPAAVAAALSGAVSSITRGAYRVIASAGLLRDPHCIRKSKRLPDRGLILAPAQAICKHCKQRRACPCIASPHLIP